MSRPISRRRFMQGALGAALAAPAAVQCASAPRRKDGLNVLFLMTDEQHWRSLSATGNSYIQTPNMDRIAKEGALFQNATCVTPYCSPSRASILTGVYPHRHRILFNVSPRRNQQKPLAYDAFPNTEMMLHERGYVTKHRGKWHLGDKGAFPCYESLPYHGLRRAGYHKLLEERLPRSEFKHIQSPGKHLGRPVKMIPCIRDGWAKFKALPRNGVYYIATIGQSMVPPKLLPETLITNQVMEQIEANKDRHFMITASWSPPHDLWVIPEPYYSMVDRRKIQLPGATDLPWWDKNGKSKRLGDIIGPEGIREYAAIYHGMVKYIDDLLGRILKQIDDLGLTENTLVIFTTDHGDMVGAHGCVGKSISSMFDDLVRIPLLMRLPGRIKPGTVVREPVSQIDYMPTILDYVGAPIPHKIHGRSMRPLVEGRKVEWREHAFCQRADRIRMARVGDLKYTFGLLGKRKMVALYDLADDPHEDHNLADRKAHAGTVRKMHDKLLSVIIADGDPDAGKLPKDPLG